MNTIDPKTLRSVLRTVHLAGTPALGALVYSPSLRAEPAFVLTLQFGVFPAVALAGVAMWLAPRLRRGASVRGAARRPS